MSTTAVPPRSGGCDAGSRQRCPTWPIDAEAVRRRLPGRRPRRVRRRGRGAEQLLRRRPGRYRPGLCRRDPSQPRPRRRCSTRSSAGTRPSPSSAPSTARRCEPDHAYVLSAAATLTVRENRLHLADRDMRQRKPIDIFFGSLAADRGAAAVGVVLSGGGRRHARPQGDQGGGGLTLAQGATAPGRRSPRMPDSAIATGVVDLALPVRARWPRGWSSFARGPGSTARRQPGRGASGRADLAEARREICAILRNQLGHDFAGYKDQDLPAPGAAAHAGAAARRRSRATSSGCGRSREEVGAAVPRPADRRHQLLPRRRGLRGAGASWSCRSCSRARGADDTVRVWVPGCATGEEVYSLAILLREHMDRLARRAAGADLRHRHRRARRSAVARAGRYPGAAARQRLARAAASASSPPTAAATSSRKEVRDLCVFSPHSVIRDPPFSRIDLVSCRNLLIYLGRRAAGRRSSRSSTTRCGPTATCSSAPRRTSASIGDLFAPVEKKHRIFRRRGRGRPACDLPLWRSAALRAGPADAPARAPAGAGRLALRQTVEAQVLERFAPPHRGGEPRGRHRLLLRPGPASTSRPPPGTPSRQLLAMARKGLRLDLRTALREAIETGRTVARDGIAVEVEDGRVQPVTLTVEPLRDAAIATSRSSSCSSPTTGRAAAASDGARQRRGARRQRARRAARARAARDARAAAVA